jgi:antitoxin component of RelBE/YafQ-DinJ toxin-antitoxin module
MCPEDLPMNLTLSVDERLVEKARSVAAAMGKSVNQLIREYLEQITSKSTLEEDLAELRRLSEESRGDSGGWKFDRDEIHARP